MGEVINVNIRPLSSILAKYRNYSYKIEGTIAEFIDNSTQSFLDKKNREILEEQGITSCLINIEIYPEYIKITDNAFGMNELDFGRALKLDSPPVDKSGRSEQGMGLKTAATWLGNLWTVETTEYGNPNKYYAEIDVNEIEKNAPDTIPAQVTPTSFESHYTIITIKNLNQKITPGKVEKIIQKVSEIYSKDLFNKTAQIIINKQQLSYEPPKLWVNPETNAPYLETIDKVFHYEGKEYSVSGWIGIRAKASTDSAGLTLFRRGRAILTNYRPNSLMGAPNTFPYQRITGELNLDNWPVSHTKDSFMWDGGLEEYMINEIKKSADWIIKTSTKLRVKLDADSEDFKEKTSRKTEKAFESLTEIHISSENFTYESSKTTFKDNLPFERTIQNEQEHETPFELLKEDTVYKEDDVLSCKHVNQIPIPFDGKIYQFIIEDATTIQKDWLRIESTSENNTFKIYVDTSMAFFNDYSKDLKCSALLQKITLSIALSLISSKEQGVKNINIFNEILNKIIANTK